MNVNAHIIKLTWNFRIIFDRNSFKELAAIPFFRLGFELKQILNPFILPFENWRKRAIQISNVKPLSLCWHYLNNNIYFPDMKMIISPNLTLRNMSHNILQDSSCYIHLNNWCAMIYLTWYSQYNWNATTWAIVIKHLEINEK